MFSEVVDAVEGATDAGLLDRLGELECRRRVLAAEEAVVLAELERRKVFARDGHASMWGLLRAMVGWSDAECRSRMRIARLVAEFDDAGEWLHEEMVPVASITEIARGFANPRCGGEIESVLGTLLSEASRLEFDDLKKLVRHWERHADADGSHKDEVANHEARNAHLVVAGCVPR